MDRNSFVKEKSNSPVCTKFIRFAPIPMDQDQDQDQNQEQYPNNEDKSKIGEKNTRTQDNKLVEIKLQINSVKEIMQKNIDQAIREDNLEVPTSDRLNQNTNHFDKNATELKKQMYLKRAKLVVIGIMIFLTLVGVIVGIIYGATKK